MADERTAVTLPLLPLRNGVVVPGMVVTIALESEEARRAVEAASDRRVVLVPRVGEGYARVGTVAVVEQVEGSGPQGGAALVRGIARAHIGAGRVGAGGALLVEVETIAPAPMTAGEELVAEYRAVIGAILQHRGMGRLAERLLAVDDPGELADLAVYSPDLSPEQKVELLETVDGRRRLEKVLEWMGAVLADLELREKVRNSAAERIERGQREYLLRQQMAALREELGETDGDAVSDYRRRLADRELPEPVRAAVEREIERLERVGETSAELGWIRTWLDTVLEVPWEVRDVDRLDLDEAREVLDADHTGLEDVKQRVVEHLAVRKLRADRRIEPEVGRQAGGAILLLVGPPGVGKTSLGASVARALGRRFVRVALGGIRDEAEIRGHRRTYVGARPGRIVRALTEAGSMNPVVLLDELDKVGSDWRGDPAAALLEVLDPAQNHTFRDHYLELDLDLSEVLFIATANLIDTIPGPLLDRTELIRLDGYTDDEKVAIARRHLLGRQVRQAGLRPEELSVTDDALRIVIESYTRESGVRALERALGKLARKVATQVAGGESAVVEVIDREAVEALLGRPTHRRDEADRAEQAGVATGLAVTGAGGEVLFVEASVMEGEGGLTITGQLGDVMRESAQIALSYVRANASRLALDPARLAGHFHLHVPAGAVPKDGPSAGVTMTTALVSLLLGRPARADVGMTGEVTLQGRVLPIGGVKQKLLAAHRAGLREVILPSGNHHDLEEVPEAVLAELTVHEVDDVAQALAVVLREAEPAAA